MAEKVEYVKRVFTREFMQEEVLWGPGEGVEIVEDKIIDHTRWSVIHDLTFRYEDKLYNTSYSTGATEQQYEGPWEYEDKVECLQVHPTEVTRIKYVGVKKEDPNENS